VPDLPAGSERTTKGNPGSMSTLTERGGVCLCGAIGAISLIFGGRKPAHFVCGKCKRKFDLDGEEIT
jgi:hypothetical protein